MFLTGCHSSPVRSVGVGGVISSELMLFWLKKGGSGFLGIGWRWFLGLEWILGRGWDEDGGRIWPPHLLPLRQYLYFTIFLVLFSICVFMGLTRPPKMPNLHRSFVIFLTNPVHNECRPMCVFCFQTHLTDQPKSLRFLTLLRWCRVPGSGFLFSLQNAGFIHLYLTFEYLE